MGKWEKTPKPLKTLGFWLFKSGQKVGRKWANGHFWTKIFKNFEFKTSDFYVLPSFARVVPTFYLTKVGRNFTHFSSKIAKRKAPVRPTKDPTRANLVMNATIIITPLCNLQKLLSDTIHGVKVVFKLCIIQCAVVPFFHLFCHF